MNPDVLDKIRAIADEVSRREGCMLYDIEFLHTPSSYRTLRVYIDTDKDGVSVDLCANVSRGMSLLLDVQDLIPGGRYELEVSSPGLERELKLPWHFQKVAGQTVKVITHEAIPQLKGQVKSLTAELKSANEEAFTLLTPQGDVEIPYSNVKKANVVFDLKKQDRKKR